MNEMPGNDVHTFMAILDNTIKDGSVFELPVLSGSMMKELVPGRSVSIRVVRSFWRLRVGDIVVFRSGTKLFSHRVLMRINLFGMRKIFQKGDVNLTGSWIDSRHVIGKVIESVDIRGRRHDYEAPVGIFSSKVKAFCQLSRMGVIPILDCVKKCIRIILFHH